MILEKSKSLQCHYLKKKHEMRKNLIKIRLPI